MDRSKGFPQLQYPSPPPPRVLQRSPLPPYCLAAGEHYLLRLQIHIEDGDDQLILVVSLRWYYIIFVITFIPNNSCCVSGSGSWANHSNTLVLPCHQRWWDCCELLCHGVRSSSYISSSALWKPKITPFHGFSVEQREGLLIVLYSCTLAHVILC